MKNIPENTTVNEDSADQETSVGNFDSGQTVNENGVNVKNLERCFDRKIDKKWVLLLTRSKTGLRARF